jgi:hypothetical protein
MEQLLQVLSWQNMTETITKRKLTLGGIIEVVHVSIRYQWLPSHHCQTYSGEQVMKNSFLSCWMLLTMLMGLWGELHVSQSACSLKFIYDHNILSHRWSCFHACDSLTLNITFVFIAFARLHCQCWQNLDVPFWCTKKWQTHLLIPRAWRQGSHQAMLELTADIWTLGL